MAKYKVVLMVDGNRIDAVTKKAKAAFGADLVVNKVDLAKSRADRLKEIASQVSDCATDVEGLKGELEEWKEALPENLQKGVLASELDDAIQMLEEIKDALENVSFDDVSFPSMM